MDTRNKIVPLTSVAALANSEWTAVVGRFDPMTALEAERLAELGKGRKLLAVVVEDGGALLDASARAALVAALRGVHAVTIASPQSWQAVLKNRPTVRVVEDHAADAARRNAFIEMVLAKQRLR